MDIALAVALAVLIVAFVAVPLRRGSTSGYQQDPTIADLEARKESKYREIRDAEADHAAGKLSDEDYERTRAELRREASEILAALERVRGGDSPSVSSDPPGVN